MRLKLINSLLIALPIFLLACSAAAIKPGSDLVNGADLAFTVKFNEIWGYIVRSHVSGVENTEDAKLECALDAVSGGLSKCLDDPYSMYLGPDAWKHDQEQVDGVYGGVGLELGLYHNKVVVVTPIRGSPAWASSAFVPGDVIEKVNSENTADKGLVEVVNKIIGPAGTSVTIEVRRDGDMIPPITLTRSDIVIKAVETETISGDIYYIKTNQLTERFAYEFFNAFILAIGDDNGKIIPEALQRSVVLDLRDNPGGLLSAVKFVSYFFTADPQKDVVYALRKKDGEELVLARDVIRQFKKINPKIKIPPGAFARTNIVVLTNGGSASASEIFAALLRDWLQVPLVGSKTFGKGSVQIRINLKDGDGMKLTVAEYFVGNNGVKVSKIGLDPDYWVENPPQKRRDPSLGPPPLVDLEHDLQLKKAIEVLRNRAKNK